MTDKKISELDEKVTISNNDEFPIVDTDGGKTTKRVLPVSLFGAPPPIGSVTPNTGRFTTLQVGLGSNINQFSTDGLLTGNSDTNVPTEKAVKTYVDIHAGGGVGHAFASGGSGLRALVRCQAGGR